MNLHKVFLIGVPNDPIHLFGDILYHFGPISRVDLSLKLDIGSVWIIVALYLFQVSQAQVLQCFVEKMAGGVVSSVVSSPLPINFALYMDTNAETFPLVALEIADMPHFVTTVFNLFDVEF